MNIRPKILVCTVGTSLFYPNLSRMKAGQYDRGQPSDIMAEDYQLLKSAGLLGDQESLCRILKSIKDYFQAEDWPQLVKLLMKLPPALRLLGAEINSVEAMIRKNFLSDKRERIIFLVSDTKDGQNIGTILKEYFANSQNPIKFNTSDVRVVKGLQDDRPEEFQKTGLTNLVRLLGEELRKWGANYTAINATGGYKAQIAIAVAFGQVTKIPVFYKHERFDQIIPFPKVPFTIDLSLIDRYLDFWARISEPSGVLTFEELAGYIDPGTEAFEMIHPLLESINEEGKNYYCLSSLGMIYWEGYLIRHPDVCLDPQLANDRRGCSFREDHYPIGFKAYVDKIYNAFNFITGCHSVPYSGQKGIQCNEFYIRSKKIYGHYVDKNNFGGRFEIATTAANPLERKGAFNRLNHWLKKS